MSSVDFSKINVAEAAGQPPNGWQKQERTEAPPTTDAEPGAAPEPAQFTFYTKSGLQKRPKREWLIPYILQKNSQAALVARSGNFKTFEATNIVGCLTTGTPWHGIDHGDPKNAAYIIAEDDDGFLQRLEGWEIGRGVSIPDERLAILPEPVNFLMNRQNQDVPRFLEALDALPFTPDILVIDTLSRCMVGGSINDPKDMTSFVANVDHVRAATGACVLIIHHENKSGVMSGSQVLRDWAHTVMHIKRPDLQKLHCTLVCEKQKSSKEFTDIPLTGRVIDLPDGETTLVFDRDTQPPGPGTKVTMHQRKVLECLHAQPMGAAVGVISEVTGIGASLYAMLDTLTERNLIAAEGEAKSRSRYYLLTKLGREVLGAMTND